MASSPNSSGTRLRNLRKALSDPRTRLVFFGGIALAALVMAFAIARLTDDAPIGDAQAQVADVAVPTSAQPAGQPVNTQVYDELTAKVEQQAVAQAKQTEGTAMPIPRVGEAPPKSDPASEQVMPTAVATTDAASAAQQPSQQQQQQLQQLEEQLRQQRYAAMARQFDLLVGRWGASDGAFQSQRVALPAEPASGAPAGNGSAAGADVPLAPSGASLVRANTLALGVTLSEGNTDDALPLVRARVLSGPAKGAVLSGQIQVGQRAEGGLLRFTQLTPADGGPTVAIDAVAVDPHTSRTAVATDVNRHTVSRMGALFLSSVLGGVSEAMLRGGQQETIVSTGQTTVVQRDAYTDRDLALIGLGRVGTNAAGMVGTAVNRPPTVRLRAGTEIGVLFLQDVNL